MQVRIIDFQINNSGRINHHVLGGIPLYWIRPTDLIMGRPHRNWICGHSHYGDEIYPTSDLAMEASHGPS